MSYRELTYIESTGSQYIDTGLAPNPHYSIEVSFMISQQTSNWDTVFGTRNGSYARFTARFRNSKTGSLGIQYSNASTAKCAEYSGGSKPTFGDDFHIIKLDKNLFYCDGSLNKTFSSPADDVSFPYNLYLFANNDAGTAGDYAYIRMAYCKIWNDTELVRDFIPVLDANDVACLYDRVTETCFYNQGSGTFTAGDILPDEDPEPEEPSYRELEYIESTGTQYIDTLVSGGESAAYEISFNPLTLRTSYEHYFAGTNTTSTSQTPKLYYNDSGVVAQAVKDKDIKLSGMSTDVVVKYNADGMICVNDVSTATAANNGWGDMTWWVFNSHSEPNLASSMRLYYLNMWKDGVLVREYSPAIDSDGVACLYDSVSETYFYNQGSGAFVAGPIVVEPEEPDDGPKYTELEYIQSADNQYIDTGIIPTDHQIEIKFDCLAYDNAEHLFGTSSMYYYYHFTTYNNSYYWGYNGTEGNGGSWTTGPHVLVYNAVDNYRISLDDVILAEGTACVSPNVLWLFRRESEANFKGRLYYAKITDRSTGELVRDFIPVLDKNNVACLYDRVTESYFYNQGSGLFATGRAVYKFDGKVREDDSWVDTVSSKNMVVKKGSFVWQDDCLALTKNVNYFSLPTDYGSYGTFELLVKIDESFTPVSTSNWYQASCIFGCELGGQQRDWAFVIDKNGYFAIGHGFSTITSTDVVANDGQWHTLTMVVGSSDITLYIDGEHKKTVTITMSGSQIATFGVGWNNADAATSITACIGTIKVWDTAITEDEVVSSYADSLEWLGISTDKPTHGEAIFAIENARYVTSVANSSIQWNADTPDGTSVKVFTRFSDGEYAECVNGEPISGVEVGMDLTNSTLEIKVELATEDPEVTPSLTGLSVVIQNEGDDHVMVLILGTGNTTGIQNAIGEVNVAYAGGTLRGEGGMVPSFSTSFLPTNLAYEGHQNDVEHVDVDIEVAEDLIRVYHRDREHPENISVSIEATTSLIYVDDI